MDFGKTFDMLHCKTLLEKQTSIGLNVSAATWVKKTPNTLLKNNPPKLNHTKPNPNKKNTPSPHPKPNQKNN